ncbi:MAG: hypothetical protein ACD_28C00321G0003 [uncultured bacterium]|nr:MAG: hypothetical protein ACD_28C00321G0003 [uncultured bacterium]KKT76800.1 MAG: Pyrroline-5-carboxylate reductase [Candidatus Peregrinibacteria bacterium GW2011_GWA2_44_7]
MSRSLNSKRSKVRFDSAPLILYHHSMKLFVIGAGNMGSAIIEALLDASEPLFESVNVMDHSEEKCARLRAKGAITFYSLESMIFEANSVVLVAVKPQDIDTVLEALTPRLHPESLVISIAAGVSIQRLQNKTLHPSVVRVLPNTPALIRSGVSVWMPSQEVTPHQKHTAESLFKVLGLTIEASSEDHLDAIGVLTGCGPAYTFYFIESLVQAVVALNVPEKDAVSLALQTLLGSTLLAQKQATTLSEIQTLRANVTSKGGITEKAIDVFESHDFKATVEAALKAAYDRTKELS